LDKQTIMETDDESLLISLRELSTSSRQNSQGSNLNYSEDNSDEESFSDEEESGEFSREFRGRRQRSQSLGVHAARNQRGGGHARKRGENGGGETGVFATLRRNAQLPEKTGKNLKISALEDVEKGSCFVVSAYTPGVYF
jgi:hypothetical protein